MTEAKKRKKPTPEEHVFDPAKQALCSRLGFLIRRLNQIHYALFFEECAAESITPVQYGIMTALSLRPGIDQTTIGLKLGLDRAPMADVLKRLEDKGYVERKVHPEDWRSRQAFMTNEGMKDRNFNRMSHSIAQFCGC